MKTIRLKFAFTWTMPEMNFTEDYYTVTEVSDNKTFAVNSTVTLKTVRNAGYVPQVTYATVQLESATA